MKIPVGYTPSEQPISVKFKLYWATTADGIRLYRMVGQVEYSILKRIEKERIKEL